MKLHYLVIRDYAGGLAQEKTMDIQDSFPQRVWQIV
ncbi:6-O-methylguanine DNA methyltransferase, partial [Citrobacter sp. TBCS-14]